MDLSDYMYGKIAIRAFRMVNPEHPEVHRVIEEFNSLAGLDLKNRLQENSLLQSQLNLGQSPSWRNIHMTKEAVKRIISSSRSIPVSETISPCLGLIVPSSEIL